VNRLNVQCVGKRLVDQARGLVFPGTPSCGWKGELDTLKAELVRKTCPNCGGRLELRQEIGR
jgi:hypothetical protein